MNAGEVSSAAGALRNLLSALAAVRANPLPRPLSGATNRQRSPRRRDESGRRWRRMHQTDAPLVLPIMGDSAVQVCNHCHGLQFAKNADT
jgi:hypothetical protein